MPIYAYRCASCGHAQDVLQKMSDPVLTVCPACGAATYQKQVTAAGFQLKGSGWYVTDFRDGPKKPDAGAPKSDGGDAGKPAEPAPASTASESKAEPASTPAASPAPAAAPPAKPNT
ncbi:FmdB family zinc ribbon protein [Piscinibacter koreensis]|uniref:Zinc ribbon domain-containing protein n=1 Tax=Piscinibacter koreensis TaxID=2742824 RepID=A0A7Y6NM99_9BURK|nr:FmdB family zinc ribbon protein [Schlegelella koreensis]NUZ05775.1 zinc ribbon domain-containing protein [Schlegelella koreensis]